MGDEEPPAPHPVWYWDQNEYAHLDLAAAQKQRLSGVFKEDYLALCQLCEVAPHPCVLPPPAPRECPTSAPPTREGQLSRSGTPLPPMSTPGSDFTADGEGEGAGAGAGASAESPLDGYDMSPEHCVTVRHMLLDTPTLQLASLALVDCFSVTELTLSHCGLTGAQVALLARALPASGVRVLTVEFNPIAPFDEQAVYAAAAADGSQSGSAPTSARKSRPTSAAPRGGGGGDDGEADADAGAAAAAAEPRDPSCVWALLLRDGAPTQRLVLRGNDITSEGAAAIAERLAVPQSVESVNLFRNRIDDDGGEALAAALEFAANVQSLSLAANPVGARTLAALTRILREHELDAAAQERHQEASDRIGLLNRGVVNANRTKRWDPPLPEVADVARLRHPDDDADNGSFFRNQSLVDINLGSTALTDADVAAFAAAFSRPKSPRASPRSEVSGSVVSAAPAEEIAPPALRLLSLSRLGLAEATKAAVAEGFPGCRLTF